jgi:tetratricopeptide (TPR) repeat protein
MTAHLAMAEALAPGGELGAPGRIARLLLLVLSGREREAARAIDTSRSDRRRTPVLETWLRIAEARNTDDWRILSSQENASLLERLELFRAMSRTMDTAQAMERAGELEWDYEPPALVRMLESLLNRDSSVQSPRDWVHIAVENYEGPSDGGYFRGDVLSRERRAADAQRRRYHDDSWSLGDALNAPRERFWGRSGPSVLGWGAWAAFYQRHFADHLFKADTYYRLGLGLPGLADDYASRADWYLGDMRLHAFVRMLRTARPRVLVEDIDAAPEVVRLTTTHPEDINSVMWQFAAHTTRQMALSQGLPTGADWFSSRLAETTAFDPAGRLRILGWERSPEHIERAREVAPSNRDLWSFYLELPREAPIDLSEVSAEMNRRLEFDFRALRRLRRESNGEEALSLSVRMCEIEPSSCANLGYRYADLGREEEAAAAFQRAVDRAQDTVYVANNVDWLVHYYHREGRDDEAMAGAEKAESTGAGGGYRVMGELLEDLGRYQEAETRFKRNRDRYDQPAFLIAFYFRRARRDGMTAYDGKFEEAVRTSFPRGLEPFDIDSIESPPVDGVLINSNSARLRNAGLAPGDIVVALDDWRVRSWEQYQAVRAFTRAPSMKLTIWRVNQFMDIDANVSFRRFYVDMITYEPRWSIDR